MFCAGTSNSSFFDPGAEIIFGPNQGQEIGYFTNPVNRPISVPLEQPREINKRKRNLSENPGTSNSSFFGHDAAIYFGYNQCQEIGNFTNPLTRSIPVPFDQPPEKNKKKRNLPENSGTSNSSFFGHDAAIYFGPNQGQEIGNFTNPMTRQISVPSEQPPKKNKKKRNLPGNPECELDPNAEVVALSPASLMATNRFFCQICNKGFAREQNLQLHRRAHNLSGNLRQRTKAKEMKRKKVYVCPEPTCIYHNPSRAMVDLTGIKRHFVRKHYNGEKKYKCDTCSKTYAVEDDWKAHVKTCGSKKENSSDRGTNVFRKETLATNKVQCNDLAVENDNLSAPPMNPNANPVQSNFHFNPLPPPPSFYTYPSSNSYFPDTWEPSPLNSNLKPQIYMNMTNYNEPHSNTPLMNSPFGYSQYAPTTTPPSFSDKTLLQNAATGQSSSIMSNPPDMHATSNWQMNSGLQTRDFLGLANQYTGINFEHGEESGRVSANYSGQVEYQPCDRDQAGFNHQGYDDHSTSPTNWQNYWW